MSPDALEGKISPELDVSYEGSLPAGDDALHPIDIANQTNNGMHRMMLVQERL